MKSLQQIIESNLMFEAKGDILIADCGILNTSTGTLSKATNLIVDKSNYIYIVRKLDSNTVSSDLKYVAILSSRKDTRRIGVSAWFVSSQSGRQLFLGDIVEIYSGKHLQKIAEKYGKTMKIYVFK